MQIGHPNFLVAIFCVLTWWIMNDLRSFNAKCFVLWHFVSDVWSPQSAFIGVLTNYSCSCLGIQHGDQVNGMLISSRSWSDSIITILYIVLLCDHQCDDVIVGWEQFPFPCLRSPVLHSSSLPLFSSPASLLTPFSHIPSTRSSTCLPLLLFLLITSYPPSFIPPPPLPSHPCNPFLHFTSSRPCTHCCCQRCTCIFASCFSSGWKT